MFGWEFPPHISGGLGTACAGLTQALEREDVEVLFTVPKLHGAEKADHTTFINASIIPIRQRKVFTSETNTSSGASKSSHKKKRIPGISIFAEKAHRKITTIEVASSLAPYNLVSEPRSAYGLEQWNYSIGESNDRTVPADLLSSGYLRTERGMKYIKEPYAFSGTYGPKLFEEVELYAKAGAEIARKFSFDVIHAHDWMTYLAGIAAKKISGKPLLVHVHATEIDRSGQQVNPHVFAIEKKGMLKADKVITVSNWTKIIAQKHYQVPEQKIEVIHNGIAPKKDTVSKTFMPPLEAPVITFLGRVTHQKGPLYFVEAARRVHEQFPDAQFVVAGSGDQLPMMIERIAQVRLSQNFHFTGFLKDQDIDRVWSMSQVYVMPSVSEPFGIAPLEAIQAGVPVIISRQAGVSEVMPHVIKVDFWNTEALAEAICSLLRFKSLVNTLKKNGAEQIKTITWDKAAKKLTTLYYELSTKQKKSDFILSGSSTKKAKNTAVL